MIRMQPSVESAQSVAESDAVAVRRTLAGERDAYRILVERHSHHVFRLAYRMTRNQHDAEEVVQEAFPRGELSEFLVGAQESLLDDFFGVVLVPGHAVGQPEDMMAVPLDENAVGVAFPRERASDGDGVGLCNGLGALDARLHSNH